MIRRLIILLLIVGCEEPTAPEPKGEIKEVAWIYYGNHNQDMTGCFWTQEYADDESTAIPLFFEGAGGIGNGLLAGQSLTCINYGKKNYIRYNIDFNYFSIYSEGSIYPQNYDTLVYEYK